jgi:hypothetical protein
MHAWSGPARSHAQVVVAELAAMLAAREVESEFLFVHPNGRPLDHYTWGEVWRKARQAVGTTVCTHDLPTCMRPP